jgi:hypothetical protein
MNGHGIPYIQSQVTCRCALTLSKNMNEQKRNKEFIKLKLVKQNT